VQAFTLGGDLYGKGYVAYDLKTAYTATAAAFAFLNPVLMTGQLGYETDTISFKIGDGVTAYNSLPYRLTSKFTALQETAWLDVARAPGAGVFYTETFSVPAGTKAITISVQISVTSTDTMRYRPTGSGDNFAQSFHRIIAGIATGGAVQDGQAIVPVDANGKCDFAVGNANSNFSVGYPQMTWS
jgi:hypothetical protein